ncbi:MAG: S41 family peptidase [Actinobacteria bacterium]|nr:S41 family peptidase [Actinomycetota bacterium]
MKKKQPLNTFLIIGVGVIFAAGFLLGSLFNRDSSTSILDEALNKILDNTATETDKDSLQRAAIEGMLRSLGDKWSQYLPESESISFENAVEGQYSGIGVWLRSDESGLVGIAGVVPTSPAEFANLQEGDLIQAVDGETTQGKSLDTVAKLLSGKPNTTAILSVNRSEEILTFSVKRTELRSNPVQLKKLKNEIVLISISEFTRGTARSMRSALAASGVERSGVILDLRGNPGGLLVEATVVAGAFLNGGTVVEFFKPGKSPEIFNAIGDGDSKTPLVVLIDRGTASAAEIVAAALQDRNRAVIVGERTFGKAAVQDLTELSNGAAIELTIGYYLTPNGKRLEGKGLDPDILVSPNESKSVAETRALQVLLGLVASSGVRG